MNPIEKLALEFLLREAQGPEGVALLQKFVDGILEAAKVDPTIEQAVNDFIAALEPELAAQIHIN